MFEIVFERAMKVIFELKHLQANLLASMHSNYLDFCVKSLSKRLGVIHSFSEEVGDQEVEHALRVSLLQRKRRTST